MDTRKETRHPTVSAVTEHPYLRESKFVKNTFRKFEFTFTIARCISTVDVSKNMFKTRIFLSCVGVETRYWWRNNIFETVTKQSRTRMNWWTVFKRRSGLVPRFHAGVHSKRSSRMHSSCESGEWGRKEGRTEVSDDTGMDRTRQTSFKIFWRLHIRDKNDFTFNAMKITLQYRTLH